MYGCGPSLPTRLLAGLLLATALCLSGGAQAQESWALRCSGLPANAERGMAEFCAGIAAMSGNNGESAQDPQAALQHYRRSAELGFAEAEAPSMRAAGRISQPTRRMRRSGTPRRRPRAMPAPSSISATCMRRASACRRTWQRHGS